MKKLLVITAALALIASNSFAASVVGSAHDLSTAAGDYSCGFCHVPHNASQGTAATPLMMIGTGTVVSVCTACHSNAAVVADPLKQIAGLTDGIAAKTDHPVAMVVPSTAKFVVAAQGTTLSCVSCHQVHDPANVPFLISDNANSSICVACHAK